MSLSSDGAVMTMPVQPAYQGGNGGFGGCVAGAGTITPVKKSTTAVAAYMQTSCSQSALESPVAQRLEENPRSRSAKLRVAEKL